MKYYKSNELEQIEDLPQSIKQTGTCLWKATYANQTLEGLNLVRGTVLRRDTKLNMIDFIWGHHYWNVDADDANVIVDDFDFINKQCAEWDLTPKMGITIFVDGSKYKGQGPKEFIFAINDRFAKSNIDTIYVSGVAFNGTDIYPEARMDAMVSKCAQEIKGVIDGTHQLITINSNNDVAVVPVAA